MGGVVYRNRGSVDGRPQEAAVVGDHGRLRSGERQAVGPTAGGRNEGDVAVGDPKDPCSLNVDDQYGSVVKEDRTLGKTQVGRENLEGEWLMDGRLHLTPSYAQDASGVVVQEFRPHMVPERHLRQLGEDLLE